MLKHQTVFHQVETAYLSATDPFAHWMWQNHVPVVAKKAEELAHAHHADADLAVAGALLHDFGDAFVNRHDPEHEHVSQTQATEVLTKAGYSPTEIHEVLSVIIAPHSCKDGHLPSTIEGKILATADAYAHFMTDFYLQFSWMHLPEGKSYQQFIEWVNEKVDRDYEVKIFFTEVQGAVTHRYHAIKELFQVVTPSD